MNSKFTIQNAALIVLGIIVTILAITIFRGKDQSKYVDKQEMQKLQEEIDLLGRQNAELDALLHVLQDSISKKEKVLVVNNQKEVIIKHQYEKIPGNVDALDKSELRDAFSDY